MTLSENTTNEDIENDIATLFRELKVKYSGNFQNTQQLLHKIAKQVQQPVQNSSPPNIVERFLQERHGNEK